MGEREGKVGQWLGAHDVDPIEVLEAWRWGYRRFESEDAREVLKELNVTAVWHETAGRVSRWGLERGMY